MEAQVADTPKTLRTLLAEDPMSREAQEIAAQQRISTPQSRERLAAQTGTLGEQGYVVLPGLLAPERVAGIRADMDRLHGFLPLGGDSFFGTRSQRIFNILQKMPSVHALAMHEDIISLIEGYLDDQIQLSSTASNSIHPGQAAQALHQDDTYYRISRPRAPLSVTCVWAIDDFTDENGATTLTPGSHRLTAYARSDLPTVQATATAGSAVVWDGAMWHGAGANCSDQVRRAIIFTYVRGWLRPQENLFLSLSRETVQAMPRTLQRLCGWWVVGGVLGQVEGESPLKSL